MVRSGWLGGGRVGDGGGGMGRVGVLCFESCIVGRYCKRFLYSNLRKSCRGGGREKTQSQTL